MTATVPAYEWKSGRGHSVPAQTVGQIVAEIEQKHGTCHPGQLVEAARPEDSPIHNLFNWNDESAAEAHRVEQARNIIRSIRVVLVTGDQQTERLAFVSVSRAEAPKAGYASVERAMSEVSTRHAVLQDAIRQLNGLRQRYQHLDELSGVWAAVEQIEAA